MAIDSTRRPAVQPTAPSTTPGVTAPPSAAPVPRSAEGLALETALLRAGLAATPEEARALAQKLLAGLQVSYGKEGDAGKLLAQFQAKEGLPKTGKLDPETARRLTEKGLLPRGGATEGAGSKASGHSAALLQSAFEGSLGAQKGNSNLLNEAPRPTSLADKTERLHKIELDQIAQRVRAGLADHDPALKDLLSTLHAQGFGAPGGAASAETLRDAVRSFQTAAGLPPNGKLDAETQDAMRQRGVLEGAKGDEGSKAKAAGGEGADAAGAGAAKARGEAANTSRAVDAARTDARSAQDPTMRGVTSDRAQNDAEAGRAQNAGDNAALRGAEGGDGAGLNAEGDAGDLAEREGDEADQGEAAAGDDDFEDLDRGHAMFREAAAEPGHYRIIPLSQQVQRALLTIERDDDGTGGATYRWDVTFYKPGVYGPHQPAEPLWHLAVEKVSAFAPVWAEARRVLAEKLAEVEPRAVAPQAEDFTRVLRLARYRDPSPVSP